MSERSWEHHCKEISAQPRLIEIEKFHKEWEIRYTCIVDISFCPYCGEKLK